MKFNSIMVLTKNLKFNHPLVELLDGPLPFHHASEARHFNYYPQPVVTESLLVLTHMEAVKAALENGIEQIEVMVANDLDEDEIPRLVMYQTILKDKTLGQRVEVVKNLRNHLNTNTKGKEWAATLPGDINDKIGSIIGYDKETVKLWVRTHQRTVDAMKHAPQRILDNGSDATADDDACVINENAVELPEDILEPTELSDITIKMDEEKPEVFYKGIKLLLRYERTQNANGSYNLTFKNKENKNVVKIAINPYIIEEVYNSNDYQFESAEESKQQRAELKTKLAGFSGLFLPGRK